MDKILTLAKRLAPFASAESDRPKYQHRFVVRGDYAYATDGHRLVGIPTDAPEGTYFTKSAWHQVGPAPKRPYEKWPTAKIGALGERDERPDLEFPDVLRVIPRERHEEQVEIFADVLLAVANAAASLDFKANDRWERGAVLFTSQGDLPGLYATPLDPHNNPKLHAVGALCGEPVHLCDRVSGLGQTSGAYFQATYLRDAIQGAKGVLRVQFAGDLSPCRIDRADGEIHVIAPRRR